MKPINASTRISQLIKAHPEALEAIAGMDPKLQKLRNPFLRRALAGRTTIAMASKITGCKINDFFDRLKPLGFKIDVDPGAIKEEKTELPVFIRSLAKDQIIDFDVRDLLASGKDPLNPILEKVNALSPGEALRVINTFKPVPLINMLEKKGFGIYADGISDDRVETYFYKKSEGTTADMETAENLSDGWEDIWQRFDGNLIHVDVRQLEMPRPMLTILEELDKLPVDKALYVYHKRIPVFLLPELGDRKFDYRIKEIGDGEVRLLIFKEYYVYSRKQ